MARKPKGKLVLLFVCPKCGLDLTDRLKPFDVRHLEIVCPNCRAELTKEVNPCQKT